MTKPIEPQSVVRAEVARRAQEHVVVRLGDELDRLIKIGAFLREKLEQDIQLQIGKGLPRDGIKSYKELATTIESVVSAKVRFDKAAKQMADTMTPAEERKAVIQYLKACNRDDRKEILDELAEWIERRPSPGRPSRFETDPGLISKIVEGKPQRGDNPEPSVYRNPASDVRRVDRKGSDADSSMSSLDAERNTGVDTDGD